MDASTTTTVIEDSEDRAKLRVDPSKTLKGYNTLWKNGECALEIDLVASDDKKTSKNAPSKNAPCVTELIGSVSTNLRLFADGQRERNARRLARRGGPGVVVLVADDARVRLAGLCVI